MLPLMFYCCMDYAFNVAGVVAEGDTKDIGYHEKWVYREHWTFIICCNYVLALLASSISICTVVTLKLYGKMKINNSGLKGNSKQASRSSRCKDNKTFQMKYIEKVCSIKHSCKNFRFSFSCFFFVFFSWIENFVMKWVNRNILTVLSTSRLCCLSVSIENNWCSFVVAKVFSLLLCWLTPSYSWFAVVFFVSVFPSWFLRFVCGMIINFSGKSFSVQINWWVRNTDRF